MQQAWHALDAAAKQCKHTSSASGKPQPSQFRSYQCLCATITLTWAVSGRFARGIASPVSGSFSRPKPLAISVKCGLVKQSMTAVRFRLFMMFGSTVSVSKMDLLFGSSMNFRAPRYLGRQAGRQAGRHRGLVWFFRGSLLLVCTACVCRCRLSWSNLDSGSRCCLCSRQNPFSGLCVTDVSPFTTHPVKNGFPQHGPLVAAVDILPLHNDGLTQ